MKRKDPSIAALLSFIFPGSGFIYCEKIGWGVCTFLLWLYFTYTLIKNIVTFHSTDAIISFILTFVMWLSGIFSSYKEAKKFNQRIENGNQTQSFQ